MRRTTATITAKPPYLINLSTKQTLIAFSTSSFGRGGDGRGRGRGGSPPLFGFSTPPRAPGQPPDEAPPKPQEPSPLGHGHGRGRGKPLPPPSPVLPSFSSFVSSGPGRGRGGEAHSFNPVPHPHPPPPSPPPPPQRQQVIGESEAESPPIAAENGGNLPEKIASLLPGVGRGQTEIQRVQHVNRHVRPRRDSVARAPAAPQEAAVAAPKMSREEALKHALEVLGRDAEAAGDRERGRGRGMRGRGTGRGRGRFEEAEDEETGLYLGDDADGERLAKRLGPGLMSQLAEDFEVADRILPSTIEQMHLEALDMNLKLECEPEFVMGDLERNPDIDEKPPIPLRDALEKAKPFLMAYENIESQEEWEDIMKETMEKVPLLKEIVDHYSGPERVVAKKQHQELERVAKTLPEGAPNSVKQFTERTVLSLQNNPGWGFHRKCQFMDKLVWRMSQHYK